MAELIDWMHHESVTRAGTNTATGYIPTVKKTNADRIREMTDEELAEFLMKPTRIIPKYECEDCENDCTECVLEWLREETKK